MRIIGGSFKGTKIFEAFDKNTRPLKDLVKESILNILEYSKDAKIDLNNSLVLDLFAGTGSFGLECISRGASNIVFYENYENVLKILKKNIVHLGCGNKTKVIDLNIFNKNAFHSLNNQFEIIFLDPPYKEKKIINLLKTIMELKLLKKNGIIIIHRHKKEKDDFPIKFSILLEKYYGISKIIFGS